MFNLYLLGEKGFASLKLLNNSNFSFIDTVIVGADKDVLNDFSLEIIEFCKYRNLHYIVQNKSFLGGNAMYSIAIGWRWIINDGKRLIVFHDSLLPRLRGFNPLVTALINGDSEVGVSVIFGTEDFDRGDIILQKRFNVFYPIKIQAAIEKMSLLYGEAINELFDLSTSKFELIAVRQNESLATYSLWRDDEDYTINWSNSAEYIHRFINAVGYPYKGAFTTLNNSRVIIKDSFIVEDVIIENRTPGKIIFKKGKKYYVTCGTGLLCIEDFYDIDGNLIELTNFRLRFK